MLPISAIRRVVVVTEVVFRTTTCYKNGFGYNHLSDNIGWCRSFCNLDAFAPIFFLFNKKC